MKNVLFDHLEVFLRLAAAGQLFIALLGPMIPRLLDWREPIARMPLLVREVFHIHTFFIALTCAIFGTLTWRFAADLALPPHDLMRWLACSIGLFWGIRSIMQWTHYSPSHWRGLPGRTVAHWALFLGYAAFSITYLLAAFRR
jgi:hypothetical protein